MSHSSLRLSILALLASCLFLPAWGASVSARSTSSTWARP